MMLENYLIKYQKVVLGLLIILVVIIFELLYKAWPKESAIKGTTMQTPNPLGNLLKGFKIPSLPDIKVILPSLPSVPYVPTVPDAPDIPPVYMPPPDHPTWLPPPKSGGINGKPGWTPNHPPFEY